MGLMDWWRGRPATPRDRRFVEDGPWLRTLFEHAPDAYFLCDARGVFLDGNRAAEVMVGFPREELIGKSFLDVTALLPVDGRPKALALLARAAARRPVGPDELVLRRKDGTRFTAEISSQPVEVDGRMVILGIARDVTARSRVESLVRAQRDLSIALNATNDLDEALRLCLKKAVEVSEMDCGGIYEVDASGGLRLRVHDGIGEEFTATAAYLPADSPHARLALDTDPLYAAVADMPLPDETPYGAEGLLAVAVVPIRHDGQFVALLNLGSHTANTVPQYARAGVEAIAGQIGSAVARIQATEHLRNSEQTIRAMLDATTDVAVLLEPDGTFVAVNETAARHVGMTPEQMVGRCAYEFFPPDVATERERLAEQAIAEYRPISFEDESNGRFYHNSVYPVFNEHGAVVQIAIYTHDITEVMRAQRQLEDSERRYRVLVESMPARLCRYGPDCRISFVNPQLAHELGCSADALVGRDALELVAPERRDDVRRRIALLTPHSDTLCHEARAMTPAGDPCWHRWTTRAVFDEDGHITEYQSVGIDVTERRLAEERLRSNLEFSNTLLDTIGSPVFYKNLDGIYIGCNRAFAETIVGLPVEEIIGRSPFDFGSRMPPDLAEIYHAHDLDLLQHPGAQTYEAPAQCADGVRRSFIFNRATFNDAAGQVAGIVGVMLDITDREMAEQELRKERDFSNAIIQNSPTFFVAVEPDGRVAMANEAFLRATGYAPEEIVGVDYVQVFVPPEDRASAGRTFSEFCLSPRPTVHRMRLQARDGSMIVVECHSMPVFEPSGELSFIIAIGVDLTERHDLESRLREVQKREAIGLLASGVAHDFNNILTAIMGRMSLMLACDDIDEKTTADLEQMSRACARGADLVERLLAFSRRVQPNYEPVAPGPLVEAAARSLAEALPPGVEMNTCVAPDLGIVRAAPHQIEQVIVNLGLNAIEAMSESGTLTILARNITIDGSLEHVHGVEGRGDYVLIAVADTGGGIPEDEVDHIFEPFQTTKSRAEHSGLGLAVVHSIVQAHSGFVRVDTQEEKGTVIEVYLPSVGEAEVSQPEPGPASAAGSVFTVLVVDDEPAVARLAADIIEHHGHRTLIAGDGIEALELFAQHRADIDLVVLDLIMPRMDGETCIGMLRESDPDIPIIVASGAMLSEEARAKLMVRIDAFLSKPFTLDNLIDTIDSVTDRRRRGSS